MQRMVVFYRRGNSAEFDYGPGIVFDAVGPKKA